MTGIIKVGDVVSALILSPRSHELAVMAVARPREATRHGTKSALLPTFISYERRVM